MPTQRDAPSSQSGATTPAQLAALKLPLHGATSPSSHSEGTTPGSFANAPDIGGPLGFSSPDTPAMPAPSTKTAWDFMPDDWTLVDGCWQAPAGFAPVTQLDHARLGVITDAMRRVAEREGHLTPEQVRDEVAAGRMIIPANRVHLAGRLDPVAIGRVSRTKVNANMGASPVSSGTESELEKLRWAKRWGADTVMDLSTGGDVDACREAIIQGSTLPIGTVPIYSMILGSSIEELTEARILSEIEHQARQGVDYFTIHAGLRREHLPLVKGRLAGIISRGGSLLAKWMIHHEADNPTYTCFEKICDIMRQYDVAFSLGDGLRPGSLADATDAAQLAELVTLAELTERAWKKGCQVMVEGPGHVPFDQIEYNMKVERALCHGAPFYVLGPIVTDVFPGYDHITSSIGATAAAYHGAAMLCYVTPKEHLGLPDKDDVKQGCVTYKIAAHAADVALGIPGSRDWDDEITKARAALNWDKHFELSFDPDFARELHGDELEPDADYCGMCGHDWCAVRISKEIVAFAAGKAEGSTVEDGATLTEAQRRLLEERGLRDPAELDRLARKARKLAAKARDGKAPCHSDNVDARRAQHLQDGKQDGPS
ncbi:MAG: phosphomethylpyrimidine synthase ThiC [Deltaproteobacteria bacterium]|nr:phosphomethylpyrimidine synthase ThiC [Deltaproteobacteria bacterium]